MIAAGALALAAIVGLMLDVSVSASYSQGIDVVRGGRARLLNLVYLGLAVAAGLAIVAIERRYNSRERSQ